MFRPGDVVKFYSFVANKQKFHLCISITGGFLFLNSYKNKSFTGDLVVPCTEILCLEPTESGKSVVSCSLIVRMDNQQLRHVRAEKIGTVNNSLLVDVIRYIENSPVLSAEDKELVLDGLGDWV